MDNSWVYTPSLPPHLFDPRLTCARLIHEGLGYKDVVLSDADEHRATVGLHSPGETVGFNFGRFPFAFDVDDFMLNYPDSLGQVLFTFWWSEAQESALILRSLNPIAARSSCIQAGRERDGGIQ